MTSLLSDLVDFEKETAKKRRLLANPIPSQQLRLHMAKDAFKSKEDALERVICYHSTFNPCNVSPVSPQRIDMIERITRIEGSLRDNLHFRDSLMNQVLRSVRIDMTL